MKNKTLKAGALMNSIVYILSSIAIGIGLAFMLLMFGFFAIIGGKGSSNPSDILQKMIEYFQKSFGVSGIFPVLIFVGIIAILVALAIMSGRVFGMASEAKEVEEKKGLNIVYIMLNVVLISLISYALFKNAEDDSIFLVIIAFSYMLIANILVVLGVFTNKKYLNGPNDPPKSIEELPKDIDKKNN